MRTRVLIALGGLVVLGSLSIAVATGMWRSNSASQKDVTGQSLVTVESRSTETLAAEGPQLGMPAIEKAADAKKYLFVLFCKEDDERTAASKKVFDVAMTKVSDRADSVLVNIMNPKEKPIVEKFGLDRAPMPLVLVLAPNGAITGGFPKKFEEKDLLTAFASPATEKCLKALQDNKLVFLCVQNESTKSNEAVMKGIRDFQADSQYSEVTEIVMLNPTNGIEASFLGDLKIDSKTPDAVCVFMAPPGGVIAEFTGETKKEDLVAALKKASSACGTGGTCGPGGCGPKQ